MGSFKNNVRLTRPMTQNIVAGMILFCLPGLYTALTGLGAGGGKSSSGVVANQTNSILYGLFTLSAMLAGTAINIFGPRLCMLFGGLGYPLYIGGLWYYDRTGHSWFPLFGGAMLGMLCGFMWSCAGMIAYAYAEEKQKGLFICIQWIIRALGATTGAAITLGVNYDNTKAAGVATAVYVVFIVMQICALIFGACLIISPRRVVRDDGTYLAVFKARTLRQEIAALGRCFLNKKLLILLPAMVVCDMALALVSTVNGFYFNLRTRSINNIAFQGIQMLGPALLIALLDTKLIPKRKYRGIIGVTIMGLIALGGCCGLYAWLHITDYRHLKKTPALDYTDKNYAGFVVIYLLFGWVYSGFQMVVEWITASLSNDPTVLAQYAGFMRGSASFGMCISFVLAAEKVPTVGQLSIQFILYIVGIVGMYWVCIFHVKETDYFTEENTIAPHSVEEAILGEEEVKKVAGVTITKEVLEKERLKNAIASGAVPAA